MKQAGQVLVAGLLLVGALGLAATGAIVYSRLLYLGLLLVVFAWLWTRLSLWGLELNRHARTLRASVGDTFEERFEVTNRNFISRLWLEVMNESPLPFASGSRVLTLIGRRQNRSYTARSWLTRRGAFPLGPTALVSGDPFGLFQARKVFPARASLLVLPLLVPIESFPTPPGLLSGGKAIRRRAPGVTPHASGVREYAPGDPLKSIHWLSTARRGRMMTKEFEQDPQAEVWLFLDSQKALQLEMPYAEPALHTDWLFNKRPKISLPPSTLEYGVSIAASLSRYFIAQKRAVGFAAAGQVITVIPAERSERQEIKILETLTFVRGDGELSLAGLVSMQARQLAQGSSVILITAATGRDLLVAVSDLQRRNLNPVVILLRPETFGGKDRSEDALRILAGRGVGVCPVACGDDLGRVLSSFSL